jgi:hypothetical protein
MAKAGKAKTKQYVYFYGFGKKHTEGDASMKPILGGKGANLADMALADLPVPPGFTVTTEACAYYSKNNSKYPPGMWDQVLEKLGKLEKLMGKKLGDAKDPLLVSVRSGAAISMPGMMDTVLNLGMNDKSVLGFIAKTNNARAGWDCYRRFLDMFGDVVMGPTTGLTHHDFEVEMSKLKAKYGAKEDTDLSADQLKELCEVYKRVYFEKVGKAFPQDPLKQLELSINAVFGSWNSERAEKYRTINKVSGLLGTAVNMCSMVYGNMGKTSGTGVAFTRDGATGEDAPMGEYLIDAQGEDVVAGIRTPKDLNEMASENGAVLEGRGQGAARDHAAAGAPLQVPAGRRVHRPGRQALDAADPQRQAHRPGRRPLGGRDGHGQGHLHRQEAGQDPDPRGGPQHGQRRRPRAVAVPHLRPRAGEEGHPAHHRPAGRPGRRGGQDRLHRQGRGGDGQGQQERAAHPGAP